MESVWANDVIIDNQHGTRRGRGDSYCCPQESRWKRGAADRKEGVPTRKEVPPRAWLCFISRDGSGWFFLLLKDVDFDET